MRPPVDRDKERRPPVASPLVELGRAWEKVEACGAQHLEMRIIVFAEGIFAIGKKNVSHKNFFLMIYQDKYWRRGYLLPFYFIKSVAN